MVFAAAGTIFGFVLGYMAANLGDHAEARPVASVQAPGMSGGSAPGPPAAGPGAAGRDRGPTTPDPDEVRALEGLAARDETSAEARVQLGNLYMDHQQWDQAIRWYREALALSPDLADVRVDLGACLVSSGRPQDGLAEFETALKKDPTHKKALFNKGIALMQSGRPQDAVAVWQDLLKRYPNDPQLEGLKDQIERLRSARGGGVS